jgi:hypothetical protein
MNISPFEIVLALAGAALSFEVVRLRAAVRNGVDPQAVKAEVEKAAAVVVEQRIKAWEVEENERENATEKKLFDLLEKRMSEQKLVVANVQGKTKPFARPLNS